ncbi:hypothetical protein GYB22_04875 [bacterium]|nr:hypothetical protein [bacterium]
MYIGVGIGQTFQSERFSQSLDAGGNSQVQQSVFNYPGFIDRFIELYEGEPIEIMAPADFNNKGGFTFSAELGYTFNKRLVLGFGLNTFSSIVSSDLQMIYQPFSSSDQLALDGRMQVDIRTTNYSIFAEYYRKGVWQPFISLGALLNVQSRSDYDFSFGDATANTESGGASYTHFGVRAALGISRTLVDRHQINLSLATQTYSSKITETTEFDPALNLSYRFFLARPKTQFQASLVFPDLRGIEYCSSGDDDFEERLKKHFEELDSLGQAQDSALKLLEENDLASEINSIRALIDALRALDQLDKAGEESLEALQDFMNCDNTKLKKLFKESEDTRNGVINSLKFMASFLKILAKKDEKNASLLLKVAKSIEDQLEKAEKALEEDNIDDALNIIQAIKTNIAWPVDVLRIILEDIWEDLDKAFEEAGSKAAKKAIEVALEKALGASAAAAASIAEDVVNFVDFLWKWHNYDDLVDAWNDKMKEILDEMKKAGLGANEGWIGSCVFWSVKDVDKVTVSVEMVCWCEETGTWIKSDLDLDPSDEGTTKQLTFNQPGDAGNRDFKVYVPPKANRPCKSEYCYLNLNITVTQKDGSVVSGGGFSNVVR